MVGHKFAFYVTLKPNMIKDLKIRCDYREEFEFGGTLEVDEIRLVEDEILRVAGKFGVIDLGISMSELKAIIKRGEANEQTTRKHSAGENYPLSGEVKYEQ